jgi:type IV secretory pathway VirB2 component (pilin)
MSFGGSLNEPSLQNGGALTSAAAWVQQALLGSMATSVAVVAVAVVGVLMLSGRVDWRRGARVVAGCFILFGAPAIAAGLQGLVGDSGAGPTIASDPVVVVPVPPLPVLPTKPPASSYDPYAGASVPVG